MTEDDLHDSFGDEIAEALGLDEPSAPGSTAADIKRRARQRRTRRRAAAAVVAVAVVATAVGVAASRSNGPQRVRVITGPSSSVVPSTTKARGTTTTVTVAGDVGDLQEFAPVSPSAWWAVVQGGTTSQPRTFVVRTADSGRHWRNVSPMSNVVATDFFLDADSAWIETGSLSGPGSKLEPVYRTLDGGRSWERLGSVANGCELQFVDQVHGSCTILQGALGSEFVEIWRTTDGGRSWKLASRNSFTAAGGPAPTRDAVPFGCDKSITFTSPDIGWAPFSCAGGAAQIYKSTDGGSTWHLVPGVPLPPHGAIDNGSGFGIPVVSGSEIALTANLPGQPGVTAVDVSDDGGATWRTASIPDPTKQWDIDLVDPTHWRMTDGTDLMATDDAGAHWRTMTPPPTTTDPLGAPLDLKFLTPTLGWAIPGPNGGRIWWTRDGGNSWQPVSIVAGPYRIGTAVR